MLIPIIGLPPHVIGFDSPTGRSSTDLEWMRHVAQLIGWMTPGELEHFTLAERDAAVACRAKRTATTRTGPEPPGGPACLTHPCDTPVTSGR